MDTSLIILGVALIIVLYFVFYYMSMQDSLANRLDLGQIQTPITVEKLTKPGNTKYSYDLWMYVYGPKSITGDKYVFYRDGTTATQKNIGLKLKANSPTLVLEYENAAATSPQIVITDNFPFQTWVHLIVSADNSYIDIYMNGKLIRSVKDAGIKPPSETNALNFGVSQTYLAKFERTSDPTDPQTAWNHYLDGNGENPLKKLSGNYNIALSFKKGDNDSDKYNLNLLGEQ